MTLNNKTWLITGASSGFGAETAKLALAMGANLAGTFRHAEQAEAFSQSHDNAVGLVMDVTNETAVNQAVQQATQKLGAIDVLLNNAGYGEFGTIEETTDQNARDQFDTNVFGLLNVLRAVVPLMRERGQGRIFNVSSIAGLRSGPGFGLYCSSKFAVEGITEALRGEIAEFGVQVTAIEPGYFSTSFLGKSSMTAMPETVDDYASLRNGIKEWFQEKDQNKDEAGDPAKFAQVVCWLATQDVMPPRFIMGEGAVQTAKDKIAEILSVIQKTEHISSRMALGDELNLEDETLAA